jgi:DNA-binding MarR family transcriptional regulator
MMQLPSFPLKLLLEVLMKMSSYHLHGSSQEESKETFFSCRPRPNVLSKKEAIELFHALPINAKALLSLLVIETAYSSRIRSLDQWLHIAKRLGFSRQTASKWISYLCRRGWIARKNNGVKKKCTFKVTDFFSNKKFIKALSPHLPTIPKSYQQGFTHRSNIKIDKRVKLEITSACARTREDETTANEFFRKLEQEKRGSVEEVVSRSRNTWLRYHFTQKDCIMPLDQHVLQDRKAWIMSSYKEKVSQDVIDAINAISDIPLLKQHKAQLCAFSASAIRGAYDTLKGGDPFNTRAFEKLKALCLKHHKQHGIVINFGLANRLAAQYQQHTTQVPKEVNMSNQRSAQAQGGSDTSSPVFSTYKPIQAATAKDWEDTTKVKKFVDEDETFNKLKSSNPSLAAELLKFMIKSGDEAVNRGVTA